MDLATLTNFFRWCTIMNAVLLFVSAMICTFANDWVYRMHTKWYPVTREQFNIAIYGFIGFFKILFLMFNFVPYLALVIIA